MRVFRKHLLFCALIALLGEGEAAGFFPYKDVLTRDASLSRDDGSFNYRLPKSVRPISYEILLAPELQNNFTFEGIEKITAVVEEDTNTITLNVGDIKIKSQTVILNEENIYSSSKYDKVTEKYTITLSKTLVKELKILISFNFEGKLRDDMIGFYKSSYFDKDGQIKWLAATQFQATHARHAFPCFDEPSFKAIFQIRILRNKSYTCLSNMPLLTSNPQDHDMVWDTFEQTVPMSTYLIAFVISEFSYLGQDQYKVWARPAVVDQANYAHKIGKITLELLGKKLLQKYHLPKMDMVAVPDFAAGAMENWGLLMYREVNMLYDEEESSAPAQQNVAFTVAHECSHMWFGNLVTPEWWGYLWLSEGFANYFEYFATAEIEISWNIEEQFVVDVHQAALVADSLESSQPMTREVSSQSQIGGMGDIITYSKGASIIRMISLMFKKNIFPLALRDYLSKNKEKGLGHPDDLWMALQDQVGLDGSSVPMKTVMDTWTTTAGYPVVSVAISDEGVLYISQQRFFLRNLDSISTDDKWWVPLTWTTQSTRNFDDTTVKYWIFKTNNTMKVRLQKFDPKEWVIFNVQSSGFYRVNYNRNGWQLIFNVLHSDKFYDIHVSNRAALVDDLLNLGRAGYQNYETVLDGITYLKRETNYLPFRAALNGLSYLNKRFRGYEEHSLFKQYVLSLINNTRKQLEYEDREDDDRLTVLLRRDLNIWACNFDDDECVTTYVEKFQNWKAKSSITIRPNERTAAYCVGIRNGTSDDWEFLWEKYFYSDNAAEQREIINALGCSLDTTILEKYLKYAISDYQTNRIRKQDSASVFDAVSSSMIGAEYILDFVEKYHEDMEKYYGELSTVAKILDKASQSFSTQRLVGKFQDFIDRHKAKFAPILKSLETSLRNAEYELQWYKTYSGSIIQWLRKHDESVVTEPTVSSSTQSGLDDDLTRYLLPKTIIPYKYIITITTHLKDDDFTFDGNVLISVTVKEQTDLIVLHSAVLEVHSVKVKAGQDEIETKFNPVDKYEFLEIRLNRKIDADTNLTIEIAYKGALASDLNGFYKSYYLNNDGSKNWLAATQLEPVFARRMFPCFDEPAFKATFTIRVCIERGTCDAISNMNFSKIEKSDECPSGYSVFHESVKMSTYLVALIVSDFKSTERVENKYAVYARPNGVSQAEYALSVMSPLVKFFETNLTQDYQIDKLDMVALPDFQMNAMENWGLLTYREGSLLYDKNHSSITSKQAIRNVIAHEIAHQWFGNLVSPAWWKYLWLSEGFGRYFQYHATAEVFKDVTLESQFVVDHVHSAFVADSSSSTHPMTYDVFTPDEIRNMFDTISYAKAASVLRMVEKSFGKQVFYNALKGYLNDRKYDVSTPEDLYKELQTQVDLEGRNENIQEILDTWTTQPGYPVVHVTTQDNITIFRQERFLFKKPEDFFNGDIWHIPITIAFTNNDYQITTPSFWLTEEQMEIPKPEMLIVNVQQSGFYRVNYNRDHWLLLIQTLKTSDDIHEINRAALIDDLMNLARANHINYEIAISATEYLTGERNYLPWRAFYNNLPYLNRRFWGRDMEALYKKYLISLIKPLYTSLTFEDENYENDENDENENDLIRVRNMLRMYTREWACKLDIADCKFHAAKYFILKRNDLQEIPPNYRGAIYCTTMETDTTEFTYKFLQAEYKRSNVMADKLVILNSLGCSQNKNILEKLLLTAIEENSFIRFQDSTKVFSSVYDASLIGVDVVMNVIINDTNYDNMIKRFGGNKEINSIVSALASRLSTYELYGQYRKLLDWLADKDPIFKDTVDSYVTTAEYEFDWYERKVPEIFKALDQLLPNDTYRLPNTLYPELYNISLTPYIKEGTFDGNIQIYINVTKNTSAVFLNSHNLDIKKAKVYRIMSTSTKNDEDDVEVENIPSNSVLNSTTQQLKIYLTEFANAEKIRVDIEYNGTINDNMQGFYRSFYKDKNGVLRWLATTQFEPAHARQAFPCFDEPAFKSKFIINIERPTFYTSLSNMPRLKNLPSKKVNYTWDIFETSAVNMSTYLVAFVISEFKSFKPEGEINVWGRPEVVQNGYLAQQTAIAQRRILEEFTDIKYPMPKVDLIGIPDFEMGAMENWGLITFREYGLFYEEGVTTSTYEKYLITVIAHELAHTWFGNLVTCQWWDYIWLNEGFAEYLEWYTADQMLPEYKFMDQFVVYELQAALAKDSSESAHPMTNPVETPKEIKGIFDYVTYGKSSCVLRMMFNAFDEEVYKSALHDYLRDHQGGTARPTDLWESFEPHVTISENELTFEEVMNTWTNQPGYPVVHASLDDSALTLTQERFILNNKTRQSGGSMQFFYWIPIQIAISSDLIKDFNRQQFMTTNNHLILGNKAWLGPEPITMYVNPMNEWVIVNYKQTGFYRVNYDTSLWNRLIEELQSNQYGNIDVLNRAQIMDDLFYLTRAGYTDDEFWWRATKYLIQEEEHLPWRAFLNSLSYVYERFEGIQPHENNLKQYVLRLMSKTYAEVGFRDFNTEQFMGQLHREMILQWACKLDKPECIKTSVDLFASWKKGQKKISANVQPAVLCTAIKNGTRDDWNFLWKNYLTSNFASQKMVYINALGCSRDSVVLYDYLVSILYDIDDKDGPVIRRQDASAAFASVYSASQLGVNCTIDFLTTHFKRLNEYFGNWDDVRELVFNAASHISDLGIYNKLSYFLAIHPDVFQIKFVRSIENIVANNLDWYKTHGEPFGNWISTELYGKPGGCATIQPLNIILMTLVALISYFLSCH